MLEFSGSYLGVIIGIIVVTLPLVILASGYVKSPPDTAFIISGLRKKTIIGEASIKIPFLEGLDKPNLKLIPIDMKTSMAVPTADYINIQVDAAIDIEISSDPGRLVMATENFLSQNMGYISRVAREVLEDNMREIMGRMKLEKMISDRRRFVELVKKNAIPDLATMGLDIISFDVRNLSDSNGVIDDLGIDNISQIKEKAAIARAEADKEIVVAKTEVDRQANGAKINLDREVAIRNNELDTQKAESGKSTDAKQAEADAAYQIQEEQQRKAIGITTAEANITKQEKEIIIKQKMAEVAEKALDARVRKKAETDKYACQQKAEVEFYERQKNAEAKKLGVQREAKAQKSRAGAERFIREQEAQGTRMIGDTEAEATRMKGAAEAEAMEKKAEAYRKYTDAAVAEMMIKISPEMAGKITEPLAQIDRITIIGGGSDNSGMDNMAGSMTMVVMELFESIKETTGIGFGEIVKASTYDTKVNRNVHVTGVSEGDVIGEEIVKNIIKDNAQ